ncbi:LytTR family transcriptional regulator DNA-binding domain-containing protein [Bacillus sp. ISL-40]|uniref:LytR/AlgR family response regulator transcription factor n=1 Tax=unclassified Bacillus (in: firmicutes) TaxID=185979 RepID=UPI001BEA3B96|nr:MULTISPECIES: LytTR family transcriptional regulator DNA-binding domain-containing protein [unclassified Bacillus (in: firmicutes)]MBT2697323.1 LytTR family transcriptional regulator DNA-binding domain-containing protein [Bacillus sp. ISL-40]MBT2723822.1 LytTR family transcriptional regulator DNA-binding domain-containing protein [Bacillus sp. ISL-46]MBT2741860.1 LytTR family transcriptional regulator DNA-binding domain-containing protein [Bacillus sp. ISL-77]
MLKAFIVDDEPLARDELTYLLKRSKQIEIVGESDSVESSFEKISRLELDVVFLDIQLADESGIEIAALVNKLDHPPLIVFATAFDEYALKAFELNAVDYILKPFDEKRVLQTIEKLYKLIEYKKQAIPFSIQKNNFVNERSEKLAITIDEKIVIVNISDILYIGTNEGKTVIATGNSKYSVSDTLITFERKLHHSSIIRVHRAYLVNVDAIVEIEPWFNSTYNLIMKDGEKVPVSRTYTKELKQLLGF